MTSTVPAAPLDPGALEALSTEQFLQVVGQRVRRHRTRVRMSRKRLAEISGVSERYLAQLESGQGNMSIALLRKVTAAIGMKLDVLMADLEPVRLPEPRAGLQQESREDSREESREESRDESHAEMI